MPRSKKAASRGRGRGARSGNGRRMPGPATSFVSFSGTDTRHGDDDYSLQSEAFRTQQRHQSSGDFDKRLRYTKVMFVSAGDSKRSEVTESETGLAHMTLNEPSGEVQADEDDGGTMIDMSLNEDDRLSSIAGEAKSPFIIDTQGSESVVTGLPPPQTRPISPTSSSSSSDEVIVFVGRDRVGRGLKKLSENEIKSTDPYDSRIRTIEDKIHDNQTLLVMNGDRSGQSYMAHQPTTDGRHGPRSCSTHEVVLGNSMQSAMLMSEVEVARGFGLDQNYHGRKTKRKLKRTLIDDYISNMEPQERDPKLLFSQRDLSIIEIGPWRENGTSSIDPSKIQPMNEWDRSVLSGTDSDTDISSIRDEDDEVSEDNADLLQRKIDHMTDEKIAELLAKQVELGMGSSELILFDDSPEIDLDDRDLTTRHTLKPTRRNRRKMSNISRAEGGFPAASALADAYDGFDIMDFERPSLQKRLNGRRGQPAFNLSDSELEASISTAYGKDRLRKREKKEERQALRVQGLLGKKDTKVDLKTKYKEGMGIHAVKDEIKHFLMGENTTLALPPMDKADRKVVHELANAFNLKSKSAGNGNKRFPVLYRTQQRSSFSEARFAAVESRLTRRYLPRMDLGGRNSVSVPKRSGRGGGVNSGAVSYRDGDIVGGSAPELGVENKGRAMLEKMGWSTGTALGAHNNKGILQPVSHVVKTTKAGLG